MAALVDLAPRPTAALSALDLLRRYEPILRFTVGEEFFPIDVAQYLAHCSLWLHHPSRPDELLVEEGRLTLETLAAPRPARFGSIHFLNFIEPLNVAEYTAFLLSEGVKRLREKHERVFRANVGRLARVGYGSRLLDALFSLSLLLRGRVPGDTAAAASLTYRRIQEQDERFAYYGRLVQEGGWIALQYWYFYPFNNWRSGFYGANDHEADWEMVTVYLYEQPDGQLAPRWVAYASHDLQGDDQRRHWHDREEVELVGDHPVVYVGAGSHAAHFRRGEYLNQIEIRFLAPISRLANYLRRFWVRTLRQAGVDAPISGYQTFSIPFVDYARGDGLAIGHGGDHEWTPGLLEPVPGWVSQYRGLWGYYARDPLSGENAPAGPMYNRDGSVRSAWYDPVGWSGLDKVPTPTAELAVLERRRASLEQRQRELDLEIAEQSTELQELGVELGALADQSHLAGHFGSLQAQLRQVRLQVRALRREQTETSALLEALRHRRAQLDLGQPEDSRAHIARLARPASDPDLRLSRVVEVWAAVSTGLLLIGLVFLLVTAPQYLVLWLAGVLGAFIFIESLFRRQLVSLVSSLTIALAVLCALVLIYEFFWEIAVLAVLLAGLYLAWENIRELFG